MVACVGTPLGDRIRALREREGWTQAQLAAFAGVTRGWLSLVEAGDRKNPQGDLLAKVARCLGVSVEYLITGSEPRAAGPVTIDVPADNLSLRRRVANMPAEWLAAYEQFMARLILPPPADEQASDEGDDRGEGDRPDDRPVKPG